MVINLLSPKNKGVVSVTPKLQREILDSLPTHDVGDTVDWFNPSINDKDSSNPVLVMFTWGFEGSLNEVVAINLYIADNDAFTDCHAYSIMPGQMILPVTNLLIGNTYCWKMIALGYNGPLYESQINTFTIENTLPQWYYIKGSTNLRDIGGYPVGDGKTIKKGMIYRGAELDGNLNATQKDISIFANKFKIKTDLDLRTHKYAEQPLVSPIPNAKLINIPISAYAEIDLETQKNHMRQIFTILSNESSYPLFMHCIAGADRTGTVIFLLETLLGVTEQDAIMDYELTSLSVFGFRSRYQSFFREFRQILTPYGNTLQTQVTNYLLSCGITLQQMQKIKDILIK